MYLLIHKSKQINSKYEPIKVCLKLRQNKIKDFCVKYRSLGFKNSAGRGTRIKD